MTSSRRRPVDVTGRSLQWRPLDLEAFFHPRRVVVIGASAATGSGSPNTAMWDRIASWGRRAGAEVIPVNPRHNEIDGAACFESISDVPGDIDLAVILVGDAVAMFETVLERAPRYAVIFSAGFAEAGDEGRARQQRLADLVRSGPTRLLGPNTNLNAFESFRSDRPAPKVALITQSGHQGRPVFQAQDFGVALSHWAPTGNEVDLEFADFVHYFVDQDEVGAIAAYLEGFKDGRTLMLAADHAASAGVPIVCVKVGRTPEGASMAQSHTGHLAGSDAVTDAVFTQFGITRVNGLDELSDIAAMFTRTTRPKGRGVGVYTISGGTGAHMADLLAAAGVELPELARSTQHRLHDGLIPPYLRVSNPVDSGGPPAMDDRGPQILQAILADPNIDLVVCPITGAVDSLSRPLATSLVEAAATTDKAIFVVWGSPDTADPVYTDILVPSGLPTFRTFANCVAAVRAYFDWWDFQQRYRSPFAAAAIRRSPAAGRVATHLGPGAGALSEHDSKQVLAAYGIPVSRDRLVGSAAEAARAAEEIGFPVVMKACSPHLTHKSEHALVRTGVSSAAEARAVYAELVDTAHRVRPSTDPRVPLEGVLVCEMISGGLEVVVGATQDDLFGPVVMVGLGGVWVEVLGDVAFRVPPFDRREAQRMVLGLAGAPLFEGVRGRPPADVGALVDTIMRIQRLAVDHADRIAELDINPLVVRPRGQGVVALDALVVTRP